MSTQEMVSLYLPRRRGTSRSSEVLRCRLRIGGRFEVCEFDASWYAVRPKAKIARPRICNCYHFFMFDSGYLLHPEAKLELQLDRF